MYEKPTKAPARINPFPAIFLPSKIADNATKNEQGQKQMLSSMK